ncbi:MarR family winged helix-turn-helix transcriptional regulator [Streptomyces clavuligerus]|nr:MarR family transcriptional regulator [Streptomyces clavuligerus]AXU11328.1 MarR family transcriptional regulator [Streptomyces clavuligerus]MBY6301135.1 MarR family transcriptional regulator [Streptomyces clavuligerus]QCS04196.1 MarR family transcriptional regulator [Streptomyces clavuligerus]QPJ96416.1 MarR family transcriptional regulator [Streptomyces clavuligerus]QPL61468.1 MarR family transcriptional regulator [Streptomyces clavuligerus]
MSDDSVPANAPARPEGPGDPDSPRRPAAGSADPTDRLADDWLRERPDLDLGAVAVLGRLAFVAEQVTGPAGERAVRRHGISKGEFDVLATLRRGGPPYVLSPSRLSDTLLTSRAGMTKRLDRLERAGLVARSLDTEDRRSFRIALTDEGRRVADAALTDLAAALTGLVSLLDDGEREGLDRALRSLARAAGPSAAPRR